MNCVLSLGHNALQSFKMGSILLHEEHFVSRSHIDSHKHIYNTLPLINADGLLFDQDIHANNLTPYCT